MDLPIAITGIAPILMHSGQTADPLNQFAKALGRISKKRGKTDDDLEDLSLLEWWAGLYLDQTPTIDGDGAVTAKPGTKIILPAHLIDSVIREGARKNKMGKAASAGCIVDGDAKFEYGSTLEKIVLDPEHVARHAVKVGTSKVMRTRPIFREWSASFSVIVDESVLEAQQVRDAIAAAGKLVGLGDWRPGAPRGGSFGRFALA